MFRGNKRGKQGTFCSMHPRNSIPPHRFRHGHAWHSQLQLPRGCCHRYSYDRTGHGDLILVHTLTVFRFGFHMVRSGNPERVCRCLFTSRSRTPRNCARVRHSASPERCSQPRNSSQFAIEVTPKLFSHLKNQNNAKATSLFINIAELDSCFKDSSEDIITL